MSTGVLIAVGAARFEPAVLEAIAGPDRHVVRRCVDVADLLATAASRQAQVAIVSANLGGLDTDVVARLGAEDVVVVGVTAEAASADEALLRQIGITWITTADDPASLGEIVGAATCDPVPDASTGRPARPEHSAQPTRRGRLVAVWGPTGAPGRSTVAVNLSAELARLEAPTLLVDADVYGGAVASMLGILDEASGLLAAARAANAGALNPPELARRACEVNRYLRVLTGIPRADRWTEVKTVLLRSILDSARRLAAYTVVDCAFSLELDEEITYDTAAPRRNGATLEALERADTIVVVGSADPLGLSRLIRSLAELAVMVPDAVPCVVINRVRPSLGWSHAEIASMLFQATGIEPTHALPCDYAACDKAILAGQSLVECAPEARLTRAVRALAGELAGVAVSAPSRRLSLRRR